LWNTGAAFLPLVFFKIKVIAKRQAERAYEIADAMLEARKKETE